jgi:hypothetical protein
MHIYFYRFVFRCRVVFVVVPRVVLERCNFFLHHYGCETHRMSGYELAELQPTLYYQLS